MNGQGHHRDREEFPPATVFAILLTIFLGVHFLLSLALSGSFSPDDADQLIFSQTLARGYYEQPPLYSWLTWLFFHLFGLHSASYYLLKSLALGSIYVASLLCALSLMDDSRLAVAAAFSPLLIPTFGWHSFSYLTSSNLACAATGLTFYLLVRLEHYGRWHNYLLLGLALGLGLLAKYNYLVAAVAFLVAGLTIPALRPKLLNYRFLVTLGIAGLVALPNAVWLFEHRAELLPIIGQRLQVNSHGFLQARFAGVFSLLSNFFLSLVPAALIFLFFRKHMIPRRPYGDAHRLLARFFAAASVLLLLAVLFGGAARFHERWLQPLIFLVPLYYLSCYHFDARRAQHAFELVLIVSAVVYAGVRGGQVFFGGFDRGTYPLQMNFSVTAGQLKPVVPSGSVVVSRDREICGNLRYQFPQSRHLCSSHPLYVPPLDGFTGPRILVWNINSGEALPPDLRAFVTQVLDLPIPEGLTPSFVDLPPKLVGRRVNRLAYFRLSK